MVMRDDVSLRDVAEMLDVDRPTLACLCRYLHIDPGIQRVPNDVLDRIRSQPGATHYPSLRSWLLLHASIGDVGNGAMAPDPCSGPL